MKSEVFSVLYIYVRKHESSKMGLFLDNHVKNKEYTERMAQNGAYGAYYGYGNNCCGNYNFGTMLVSMLPSLFSMGLQALDKDDSTPAPSNASAPSGSAAPSNTGAQSAPSGVTNGDASASDNGGQVSAEIQQKIDELKEELEEVYADAGATNKDIQAKIDIEDNNINNANNTLTAILNGEDEVSQNIKNIKEENPEADVSELEEQRDANKTEAQNKLETAETEKARLEVLKVKADNINEQIEVLEQQKADNANGYSIAQETQDINSFMTALKAFQANPNDPYAATALKQAYEQDAGNGHTSVENAWKLIEPKVAKVLNN